MISTGDELTCGKTVDGHSAWLSKRLQRRGIPVISHHTVGDDAERIVAVLRWAVSQAEIVLVTGGLGPTPDDLTRQALARLMETDLVLHEESLARLEEFFHRRGRTMVESNRIQVMIPKGADPVPNEIGTAPGILATIDGATVVCMPGVPDEMHAMFETSVTALLPQSQQSIAVRVLKACGLGESNLSQQFQDILADRQGDVVVGTTVSDGLISLTVTASDPSEEVASLLAGETASQLTDRLGTLLVGTGSETLPSAVGKLLGQRGQTLSLAESCTGGMVGKSITDIGGASSYFLGGVVSYANSAKRYLLGVDEELLELHGAVSEPVAREMAAGARQRFASEWAISLTGIAGPGGGGPDKPVGLVFIGVVGPDVDLVFRHVFGSSRDQIRRRASMAALNHLRIALLETES